jgi:dynein heavy chain 2
MPDAIAITTIVNFTTTRAGLSGQLLAATLQHEKPELETKKTELLRTEEDLKIQLAKLEDTLLEVKILDEILKLFFKKII